MRAFAKVVVLLSAALPAVPCTCVEPIGANAKTQMAEDTIVFGGTVIERKTLPLRDDRHTRGRYAIIFRVEEYWKGSPASTIVIYGMDSGTDCMGDGGYKVGKAYLVYGQEQEVKAMWLDGQHWLLWDDLFSDGTKILVPDTACTPGGEVSKARKALRQLGKGKRVVNHIP